MKFAATVCAVLLSPGMLYSQIPVKTWTSLLRFAVCYEEGTERIIPNCDVTLEVIPNSQWHYHGGAPRYNNPRQGTTLPTSGNTGTSGLRVVYSTSRIGQLETLRVCAVGGGCTNENYSVEISGLVELWEGYAHVMVGATTSHPYNHFFTTWCHTAALKVAAQYALEYSSTTSPEPWERVGVNDSSLPKGGVFDICATVSCDASTQNPSGGYNPWGGPHQSYGHDAGEAVDFRANQGPNNIINDINVKNRFRQICTQHFAFTYHESVGTSNEHIHCGNYQ